MCCRLVGPLTELRQEGSAKSRLFGLCKIEGSKIHVEQQRRAALVSLQRQRPLLVQGREQGLKLLNRNLSIVMVGLVPTIQPSASSVARREVDPRDKPEDDSDGVWVAGSVSVGNALGDVATAGCRLSSAPD